MAPLLLALAVLALQLVSCEVLSLKEGTVNSLVFSTTNTEYIYEYRALDPEGTFTYTIYPQSDNSGEVTTAICLDSECNEGYHSRSGFFSYSIPTHGELGGMSYDMVENPIYIKVSSPSSAKISMFAMSSIVLEDQKGYSVTPKNDTEYDYKTNGYMRYFRIFVCDDDDEPDASGYISFGNFMGDVDVYINYWNPDKSEQGKPNGANYDEKTTATHLNITNRPKFFYPGWLFIGADFTRYFEEESDTLPFSITPLLEEPNAYITKDATYDTTICFYENCFEMAKFRTNDYLKDSDGNDIDLTNLVFLVMIKDKYLHTNDGMIVLRSGSSSYYETDQEAQQDPMRKTGTDNLLEFTKDDISRIRADNIPEIYVAVTSTNSYGFPLSIPNGETIDISTTVLQDTSIVKVGSAASLFELTRSTDQSQSPVYYKRTILNTVGVNKPYYVNPEYSDGSSKQTPVCDYIVLAAPHDSSAPLETNLLTGIYIGSGSANVPNCELNENGDCTNSNYILVSKSFLKNQEEGIPIDTEMIVISNESEWYHQDGAYLLDIIDTNCDATSGTTTGITVDVLSQPSWVLYSNEEYTKYLNGSTNFDYFTFNTGDISRGISIYVELINSVESTNSVGLYASFVNPLPTSGSRFVANGHEYVPLNISESDIIEYGEPNESGRYTLYIAVDTAHKGEMKIIVSEGVGALQHIGDGQYTDVTTTVDGEMSVVMFHSSELNNQPNLILTIEGISDEWNDNVQARVCVDKELHTVFSNCSSGYVTWLSSQNKKGKIQVPLPEDSATGTHPDYYVHIISKSTGETEDIPHSSLVLRVFGEDYSELGNGETIYLETDYKLEPFLLHFSTLLYMDYTLVLSVFKSIQANTRFKVRVCADYPSFSVNYPPDINSEGVRDCETFTLVSGSDLSVDLIGDLIINETTNVDDSKFITSNNKYVSIYPERSALGTGVSAKLYEDTHVRSNKSSTLLYGEYGKTTWFRLHIISADSVNPKDLLFYEFAGENPLYYCVSSEPHVSIDHSSCIDSSTTYEEGLSVYDYTKTIKLTDIDKYYNASSDVYVYFSLFFPLAKESDYTSMSTTFSNSVVHYMELVTSENDSIDYYSYYFELSTNKRMAFYTDRFTYNSPFRFIIMPDVDDSIFNTDGTESISYTKTQVAIAHSTDYNARIPTPNIMNADTMGGGIVVYDYNIESSIGVGGNPYIAVAVQFLNNDLSYGLYKAGFVDMSSEVGHVVSSVTTMTINEVYDFSYDSTNPDQPAGTEKYSLFFYPYAKSDMVVKVYPCAGIPGIYTSYLTIKPSYRDGSSAAYPMTGHIIGRPYSVTFFDPLNVDDITVPTGFMFNATVEEGLYISDPDPENNIRWDAEMKLISGTGVSANGGPLITKSDVRVNSQRGSEVTVEFAEAISGFTSDPTITDTYIEYALYAIPVPEEKYEFYDASPKTYCGLLKYGFPLTVDKDGKTSWKSGTINTNADGSDSNAENVVSHITLISNYNPNDYKYPSNIIVNKSGPKSRMYNVNVIAREINRTHDGDSSIIGYSAYNEVLLEISGSLPVSPGGLFGWEIAIIVVVVLVVVAVVIVVILYYHRRKVLSRNYGSLDGYGNTGKNDINVGSLEENSSMIAPTDSTRSMTKGDNRDSI